MTPAELLINEVPDPEAARRFLVQLAERLPAHASRLRTNQALLADLLMLVACSPLFATTLLQDPEHITWLERERKDVSGRDKRALLESLARFAMTHSLLEPHVMLSRFRRRELMRIFLKDVDRLASIAEITDEISNLADGILEHALRLSKQELDNRFGQPQSNDERGRIKPAEFCIVSLGKLGSKELNYSSDIDLLFIFLGHGKTSGSGIRGVISNQEYFSKLAESIIKMVGGQGGEGAAYRVDLRLRPHGRVGALALSLKETVDYYESKAAPWERQVLIRSRASAGSERIFDRFFDRVKPTVFLKDESIQNALQNVAQSKQRIDLQNRPELGTDIKLGPGGIREIEFISQAMQLAYGGRDEWLRGRHTLVSLDRLAERGHLTSKELTDLFGAYEFLRRLEHILQIQDGLQTHWVPKETNKRSTIAARMNLSPQMLDNELRRHTGNVHLIFRRVFAGEDLPAIASHAEPVAEDKAEKGNRGNEAQESSNEIVNQISKSAPRFRGIALAHPEVLKSLHVDPEELPRRNYNDILSEVVEQAGDFGAKLRELRKCWYRQLIEIVARDAFGKLSLSECKIAQTRLAETSIEIALQIAKRDVERRFGAGPNKFPVTILALGKLGSGGLDYDSDLDLVFVYGDPLITRSSSPPSAEHLNRLVETFTNVLSSMTRDGSLYRVDLRLRPHGSDGPLIISLESFVEYFRNEAAIWELLAFVKLRAVGGDAEQGAGVENSIRTTIHERALQIDPSELAAESRKIRDRLEEQKTRGKGRRDIDIKYGEGGLLDVHFAVRYLQLRHDIRDSGPDRSTLNTLNRLASELSFTKCSAYFEELGQGYVFLSKLDHALRMYVGRTSRLALGNPNVIKAVVEKLQLRNVNALEQVLSANRLAIRSGFDKCVS